MLLRGVRGVPDNRVGERLQVMVGSGGGRPGASKKNKGTEKRIKEKNRLRNGILTAVIFAPHPLFLRWTAGFFRIKNNLDEAEAESWQGEVEGERDRRARGEESARAA